MFKIVIVGVTSEARLQVSSQVQSLLASPQADANFMPRIDLQSWSLEELAFRAAPDLVILTAECFSQFGSEVYRITRQLVDTRFFAYVGNLPMELDGFERLARMGVEDTISSEIPAADFLRKIVLLGASKNRRRSGKLLLIEGCKGGVGATTLAVSLAEAGLAQGKSVALVDLDFASQDLSRFVYSKPFINENLSLLFSGAKPVTEQTVFEAMSYIWSANQGISCLSPITSEELDEYDSGQVASVYLKIFKILDESKDLVIVDAGSCSGVLLRIFRKLADRVILLIKSEPAAIYSAVQPLRDLTYLLSGSGSLDCLFIVEAQSDLTRCRELIEEVFHSTEFSSERCLEFALAVRRSFADWPLSGKGFFNYLSKADRQVYFQILSRLELLAPTAAPSTIHNSNYLDQVKQQLQGVFRKTWTTASGVKTKLVEVNS